MLHLVALECVAGLGEDVRRVLRLGLFEAETGIEALSQAQGHHDRSYTGKNWGERVYRSHVAPVGDFICLEIHED